MAKPSALVIFLLCLFPCLSIAIDPYPSFSTIDLPPGAMGPESVALDPNGGGPYVAINDGRVLKYMGPRVGFVDFAYTSSRRTKAFCDGEKDLSLGEICGRPLGFSFNAFNGVLYIVDAFHGVFEVGLKGGLATLVFDTAEGVRLNFPTGIDVDQLTGDVYVTDGSLTFDLRNITQPNLVGDDTGRLIKYSPRTKSVQVLLTGLSVPIGPAVSFDRTFVVFSERKTKSVTKYWLAGPKATRAENLVALPGYPSKIKRASNLGEFWVAVSIITDQPSFAAPYGFKINSFGTILQQKSFQGQYNNVSVSVVQEYNGRSLYLGSRGVSFVGIYSSNL